MRCDCYVRLLSAETRFSLHYGAHSPTCPRYRVSLDPVDRENDEEFRNTHDKNEGNEIVDCEYDEEDNKWDQAILGLAEAIRGLKQE